MLCALLSIDLCCYTGVGGEAGEGHVRALGVEFQQVERGKGLELGLIRRMEFHRIWKRKQGREGRVGLYIL